MSTDGIDLSSGSLKSVDHELQKFEVVGPCELGGVCIIHAQSFLDGISFLFPVIGNGVSLVL